MPDTRLLRNPSGRHARWQPACRCPAVLQALVLTLMLAAPVASMGNAPLPVGPGALDSGAIDALVARNMGEQNIPGVALAVVRRGEVVLARGYGKANLEHGIAVTPDTVFAIASVSKPLLALGVATLVEDGKLKWEDPVSAHVPGTPASWAPVTLAHLASHTSGIRRESPAFDGDKARPDLELISATFAAPLDFETGQRMQYCNICYFALAEVMARTSRDPWPRYMEKRLFAPAGMTRTRTTTVREIVPGRAASYEWRDGRQQIVREYVALRPSGAFLSTANDLARLEKGLVEGRFVKPETLRRLETPALLKDGTRGSFGPGGRTYYGLGWEISELAGWRRVAHGGSLAGFRTQYARYPEAGIAVIVLTNGASARAQKIENEVAELALRTLHPKGAPDASKLIPVYR